LKKSPLPPNVPVPNVKRGTLNPDPPSCRNSMMFLPFDQMAKCFSKSKSYSPKV
jgi:hypothetical protein